MRIFTILILLLFASWNNIYAQPDKIWATYYGEWSDVSGVVYDTSGHIYIAGIVIDSTVSLATPNSFKPDMSFDATGAISNAYLAKFDTLGNRIWGTYLGNEKNSMQPKITLDKEGNVLVTGMTQGIQNLMATPGSYIPELPLSLSSQPDKSYGYVLKFNADGTRLFGTYLDNATSGSVHFFPTAISSDENGAIIIAGIIMTPLGYVDEYIFPSPNSHMPSNLLQTIENGFLLKLSAEGVFEWGTYVGGEGIDYLQDVITNSLNEIYVIGLTKSLEYIASTDVFYENYNPGTMAFDGFIAKFDGQGQKIWGTYMNGINPSAMVMNANEDLIILGTTTNSTGITSSNVHQEEYMGDVDIVLSQWNNEGQKIWATYYGGDQKESDMGTDYYKFYYTTRALALDSDENILIGGLTLSDTGIKFGCTYESPLQQPTGFLAKFFPDGNMMWGSYFDTPIESIATSNIGRSFYIGARTKVTDGITTAGTFQENKTNNESSAFFVKMEGDFICPDLAINITKQNDSLIITDDFEHYEWYRNDTLLDVNTAWIIPEYSGIYYAQLKDSCDCIHYSDTVWIAPVSSNDLQQTLSEINIYPNPNNGMFYIQGSINDAALNKISIIINDIVGRTIFQDEILVEKNHFYHALDLIRLASGIYVITIMEGEKVHVLKWVKE